MSPCSRDTWIRFALIGALTVLVACDDDDGGSGTQTDADVVDDATGDVTTDVADAGNDVEDTRPDPDVRDDVPDVSEDTPDVPDVDDVRDVEDDGDVADVDAGDDGCVVVADDGGEVAIDGVRLLVPPGAVDDDVRICITALDEVPGGYNLRSGFFEFTPEGTEFLTPVAVELRLGTEDATNVSVFWSTDTGDWEPLATNVFDNGGTLWTRAEVTHFSRGFAGVSNDAFCAGVVCDAPPAGTCDGTVATGFGAGTCIDGECFYPPGDVDCSVFGFECADGVCVDPCEGVVCDIAPRAACDGTVLSTFDAAGTCAAGVCEYAETTVDCADSGQLCDAAAGACVDTDPCEGVVCDDPPTSECVGGVALAYEDMGTCNAGLCEYTATMTDCMAAGQLCDAATVTCIDPDPCDGVVCDAPPMDFCAADEAVSFPAMGVCVDGACEYMESRTSCSTPSETCVAGSCVSACLGVTCDAPPMDRCDGSEAVTFPATGTCMDGACDYAEAREDCSTSGRVCEMGACVDPCAGVTCDMPPAASCNGSELTTFDAAGTCAGGSCSYAPTTVDCASSGSVCDATAGACVDPCAGVSCDMPPADFCTGDILTSHPAMGMCSAGSCSYAPTTTNCADSGEVCDPAGPGCVDPCRRRRL